MPLQTKDFFENATQIAEARTRRARAEQSVFFWEKVRAATRALFDKDRTEVVTSSKNA